MDVNTVSEFLDELRDEGVLQNGVLEMAIRDQTDKDAALNPIMRAILVHALQEMNARKIGVYTTAAIMIGAINTARA
jgi:hypothetical protein